MSKEEKKVKVCNRCVAMALCPKAFKIKENDCSSYKFSGADDGKR